MVQRTLLLASASQSRQMLLKDAGIDFKVIWQTADESACDWNLPLESLVKQIAIRKMEHVIMPEGKEGDIHYVLTADTLTQDFHGAIHGKPVDRADALKKLKAVRDGARVGTAFCLDKKKFIENSWQTINRQVRFVVAECFFDVPDAWLETYFKLEHDLGASAGMRIEGFGFLFLKSIKGSYTTIVGLPLFELRQALEKVGFFNA